MRRTVGALILAAPCVWSASVAADPQPREFRISHQFKEVDARARAARVFVYEVGRRSPHLKFTVHPDNQLKIPILEQWDAVLSGKIEMSVYPLVYATRKIPEFSVILLPGIPASADLASLLKGSQFERRLQALAEANGVRIVTWWWVPGGIVSRDREIGGPETVSGLKARSADPNFDRMLKAAGATVSETFPSNELHARLGDGRLDAAITSLESMMVMRLYERAKHAVIGGIGIWTSIAPIIMSKKMWDQLSPEEQADLEEAAEVSNSFFAATQREVEIKAVETYRQAGAAVRPLKFSEYEAWLKIAKDSSWLEYRKMSPVANELFVAMVKSFVEMGPAGKAPGGTRTKDAPPEDPPAPASRRE